MKKILLVLTFLAVSLFAKIDINTATVQELSSIKGIGIKKAEAIVKYRQTHGKFKSIDDLAKVKGIGLTLVANIKNEVLNKSSKNVTKKTTKKLQSKKGDIKKLNTKKSTLKKSNNIKKHDKTKNLDIKKSSNKVDKATAKDKSKK